MNDKFRKILSLIIIFSVLMFSVTALAAGTTAVVGDETVNVYRDPYLQNYWGTLQSGTTVTVKATIAGVSQITLNGKTGYCESDALTSLASEETSVITTTKTTQNTRVYRSANIRSAYVKVPEGTEVEVLAVSGSCARIRKGKYIGYIYVGHLEAYSETTDETTDDAYTEAVDQIDSTGITSLSTMIASGRYSNEQIIFAFAIKNMGYNAAAASGLLANISAESSFNTGCVGDSGTSFGICQWHASRKTRLINYCATNGYDYTTLEGQLYYLKYELETFYPKVNTYMKGVDDSADGAYDAGYYFCYNFEAPANRVSRSKTRATSAQTNYYPKYAGYTI